MVFSNILTHIYRCFWRSCCAFRLIALRQHSGIQINPPTCTSTTTAVYIYSNWCLLLGPCFAVLLYELRNPCENACYPTFPAVFAEPSRSIAGSQQRWCRSISAGQLCSSLVWLSPSSHVRQEFTFHLTVTLRSPYAHLTLTLLTILRFEPHAFRTTYNFRANNTVDKDWRLHL